MIEKLQAFLRGTYGVGVGVVVPAAQGLDAGGAEAVEAPGQRQPQPQGALGGTLCRAALFIRIMVQLQSRSFRFVPGRAVDRQSQRRGGRM